MKAKLVILEGDSAEKYAIIPEDRSVMIGRHEECDLYLSHNGVSRKHGCLWQENGTIWIEDMKSHNGIYVNNYKIEEKMVLSLDDIIQVGVVKMQLQGLDKAKKNLPKEVGSKDREEPTFTLSADSIKSQKHLSMLHKVSKLLQSQQNATKLINSILESVILDFVLNKGYIFLKENVENLHTYRSLAADRKMSAKRFALEQEIIDHILREGKGKLYANNLANSQICSIACVPIEGNSILGAMYLDTITEESEFNQRDLDLLTAIGKQIGLALERINLGEELLASFHHYRSMYQSIVNRSGHTIYRQKLDGCLEFISPSVFKLLGYHPNELCQNAQNWQNMIHTDDREYVNNINKEVLKGRKCILQYRMIAKNKKIIWLEETRLPFKRESGKVIRIEGIIQNITKTKNLEE